MPGADGRTTVSFLNANAGEAALMVRARLGARTGAASAPKPLTTAVSWEAPFAGETEKERLAERAHQDRDIVYFLQRRRVVLSACITITRNRGRAWTNI